MGAEIASHYPEGEDLLLVGLLKGSFIFVGDLVREVARFGGDVGGLVHPAVAAARSELQRLQGLQLQPPLPDISRSLGLLRRHLEPAPQ